MLGAEEAGAQVEEARQSDRVKARGQQKWQRPVAAAEHLHSVASDGGHGGVVLVGRMAVSEKGIVRGVHHLLQDRLATPKLAPLL